jgi:hypothetical protein
VKWKVPLSQVDQVTVQASALWLVDRDSSSVYTCPFASSEEASMASTQLLQAMDVARAAAPSSGVVVRADKNLFPLLEEDL